jgi:predicted metal-dependent enzyme (double-stranded beta helix superfamily)
MRPSYDHVPRPPRRNLSGDELEAFVNEIAGRPELWIDLVKHDRTQRVYEELLSDDYVTAWLICWMDGHDTGFHDHDISSGAVSVVSGRVCEERLMFEGPTARQIYTAGGSFQFSAVDIHRVRHAGEDPAVTLHAYSPPLLSMGAYQVSENGRLERRALPSSKELRAEPAPVTLTPSPVR